MKNSWIRIVYYYLFAVVGLVLTVVAGVRLVNLGLKMTIFQQADQANYGCEARVPVPAFIDETKINSTTTAENLDLSNAQKSDINNWLADYRAWQERQAKIDYLTSQRQSEASISIAMLIIGLPLFFFHFRVIRKERIGLA
ncbi:MAG: hypothetical protein COU85_00245 [Candidatus Portnoybacteria bacterium CG10_big_fil_rev_8_21_14_0_10_44_7]|uniref:DUF5671 domain-containing protein n=1 Tax=Candidatus Portnoybacteria bacterium CG10_big_fil_rev_8_21_14_0_10_44_7 TaxID=1974816 RepID=A0A2M8KJG7_9BACT|nr:MAG: hypothetical protein COU85_00245 [Candidatus Portnoybacteria bacterium CG10_big_fil_rev_8_21_14_0_10_44_7]